jgi:NADH:ubiquinone oxidoreductase subunit
MKFLTELFAWWTGNTIGTRLFTWRFGIRVGEDGFGNVYYQTKDGKRRWVVYRDQSEASLVPPEWHGWLHYTVDVPPTEETYRAAPWQKPYEPNLTGTHAAYRPPGSILNPDAGKSRPRDYEPWRPGHSE